MLNTIQTSTQSAQDRQHAPEWLTRDLQAVIDFCVQEGDYETVEMLLEQAERESLPLECTPELYSFVSME